KTISLDRFWEGHCKQCNWHQRLDQATEQRLLAERSQGKPIPRQERPLVGMVPLWFFTPGRPARVMDTFDFSQSPEYGPGIYQWYRGLEVGIVVLSELPEVRETLVLRLMGRGKVRKQARAELHALPEGDPETAELRDFL